MPYEILEDAPTSDVGFRAYGRSLDECFADAARATLAVMLENPEVLEHPEQRTVHVDAAAPELALLGLLQEIVFFKDAESLFLAPARVTVRQQDSNWIVDAIFAGEHIDSARHLLSADVKAVTMHRLAVERTDAGWEATVVLDV